MSKEIYLVLTQTSSFVSFVLKIYTHAAFNHISISLTPDLEPMYSFGRRFPYFPYWGGFVKEHPHAGTFRRFPRTKAVVLSLSVSEEAYRGIQKVVDDMYQNKNEYGYNYIGLLLASMKISIQRKKKYYCSEFVKSLFQRFEIPGAESFGPIAEPCDFLAFPGVQMAYQGLLKDFSCLSKKQ